MTNDPRVGMVNHADERAENLFVCLVKLSRVIARCVCGLDGEFNPDLCFRRLTFHVIEFTYERGLIPPFPPRLGEVCTHGARSPADLVSERIPLLERKLAR